MGDQGLGDDLYGMSRQMQADPGMGTSVSPDQRFNITDFSPEWAYASEGVKVLVMGEFLGTYANALNFKWCCMFGDVEVPADVVGGGGLRCLLHMPWEEFPSVSLLAIVIATVRSAISSIVVVVKDHLTLYRSVN